MGTFPLTYHNEVMDEADEGLMQFSVGGAKGLVRSLPLATQAARLLRFYTKQCHITAQLP